MKTRASQIVTLIVTLIAAMTVTACGSLPMSQSAQSGQVKHPDVFHSYVD